MTFYVEFFADQVFLSFVKKHIEKETKFGLEDGAVCVMSSAAALEAIVNQLFISKTSLKYFDSFRFYEKIETLASFGGIEVNWGQGPWQGINELIKVRNWLAHYKETTIGLINSDSQWIIDNVNKKPKIEPGIVLSRSNSQKYYNAVLTGSFELAQALKAGCEFDFLLSQNYESIIVG